MSKNVSIVKIEILVFSKAFILSTVNVSQSLGKEGKKTEEVRLTDSCTIGNSIQTSGTKTQEFPNSCIHFRHNKDGLKPMKHSAATHVLQSR